MSKMSRMIVSLAIATTSLMLPLGAQAAEAAGPSVTKMNSFLCKDIMRMSGEDRVIALSLLHGYYLGKKGATEYQPGKLSQMSDDFVEYCLEHPNDQALGSFAKFAK